MTLPRIRSGRGGPGAKDSLSPNEVRLLNDLMRLGVTWQYYLIKYLEWGRSTVHKLLSYLEQKRFCTSHVDKANGKTRRKCRLTPEGEIVAKRYHAVVPSQWPAQVEVVRDSKRIGEDVLPLTVCANETKGRFINVGGGTAVFTYGSYAATVSPGSALPLRTIPRNLHVSAISGIPVLYGSPSPDGPLFCLSYPKKNS